MVLVEAGAQFRVVMIIVKAVIISRLLLFDFLAMFWQELQDDGIPTNDIDTHSFLKGSVNYLSGGTTVSPSIVAICNSVGWKISIVLYRYLSMEC